MIRIGVIADDSDTALRIKALVEESCGVRVTARQWRVPAASGGRVAR